MTSRNRSVPLYYISIDYPDQPSGGSGTKGSRPWSDQLAGPLAHLIIHQWFLISRSCFISQRFGRWLRQTVITQWNIYHLGKENKSALTSTKLPEFSTQATWNHVLDNIQSIFIASRETETIPLQKKIWGLTEKIFKIESFKRWQNDRTRGPSFGTIVYYVN